MHSLNSSAARWQNPEISYDLDIYNIYIPVRIRFTANLRSIFSDNLCTILHLSLSLFHLFQTQNSVYEIVSDVNSRQDMIEERLSCLEEKLNNIQLSLELLPDMLSRWNIYALNYKLINYERSYYTNQVKKWRGIP